METRIFYRVVTPETFSNMDCATLSEAQKALAVFGTGKGEYVEYWKEQAKKCLILKVTEITEPVENESPVTFI